MTVVVLVGVSAAALYALMTMPAWLAMSINRGSLWKLRDEIYDARRRGDLPRVSSVAHQLRIIEYAIEWLPTLTPLAIFRMSQVAAAHQVTGRRAGTPANGVDGAAAVYLAGFESEFTRLLTRHFLVGSWSGIILTAVSPSAWRLLSRVATKKRFDQATWETVEPEPRVDQWREGLITTERAVEHGKFGSTPLAAA